MVAVSLEYTALMQTTLDAVRTLQRSSIMHEADRGTAIAMCQLIQAPAEGS